MILVCLFYCGIIIFLLHVFNRLTLGISKSSKCLNGKTAIVTGGNSGIGFDTVRLLASKGCRIIVADISDAQNTCNKLIKETGNPNIIYKHLDLGNFQSVREFADDFNKSEDRLDILINNAGIGKSCVEKTVDGYPDVLQVNYLGGFLLTHLLIDKLKKCAPSRIVFTSSCMVFTHNLTKSNLLEYKLTEYPIVPINLIRTYGNSKIAVLIASNELARKLKCTGVTTYAIHPGLVRTDIYRMSLNPLSIFGVCVTIWNLICAKNSWEGAQTTIHAATSQDLEETTGKYYWDCKEMIMPRLAWDKDFAQWLFRKSEDLVHLREDERIICNK